MFSQVVPWTSRCHFCPGCPVPRARAAKLFASCLLLATCVLGYKPRAHSWVELVRPHGPHWALRLTVPLTTVLGWVSLQARQGFPLSTLHAGVPRNHCTSSYRLFIAFLLLVSNIWLWWPPNDGGFKTPECISMSSSVIWNFKERTDCSYYELIWVQYWLKAEK